jgi:CBS domain containing-hemolysin-like protein
VRFQREALGPDIRTVNDLIRRKLNRPVKGGDIVKSDGLRFLVRKVRRQHVMEAQVNRDESGRLTESGEFAAPPLSINP